MNYGPLEFAAHLNRKGATTRDPADTQEKNQLTIVSGPNELVRVAQEARVEAVSVYEAVAMRAPCSQVSDAPEMGSDPIS